MPRLPDPDGLPTTWTDACGHHCGIDNMHGDNGTSYRHCPGCHHRHPDTGGCDESLPQLPEWQPSPPTVAVYRPPWSTRRRD